jgi:hypothetical protein
MRMATTVASAKTTNASVEKAIRMVLDIEIAYPEARPRLTTTLPLARKLHITNVPFE